MVWYKAWVESRLRFLAAAAVMAAVCGAAVLGHDAIQSVLANRPAPPATYAAYVHRVSYGGLTRVLFMTFAMVLGVGGLLRERELGTSAFTLALPVARTRLVLVRAAAGLLEIAAIALIQGLAIVTLSRGLKARYPRHRAIARWTFPIAMTPPYRSASWRFRLRKLKSMMSMPPIGSG